jgi:malate dehydrogenase
MVGGATLTKLIGTSAWYAPGAAGAALVNSILRDEKKLFTCCVSLEGEYGQSDICLGVPVVIGKNGWEKFFHSNSMLLNKQPLKKAQQL